MDFNYFVFLKKVNLVDRAENKEENKKKKLKFLLRKKIKNDEFSK